MICMTEMSIDPALVKINLSLLVLFEILGLLEDVFVDFVAVDRRIAVFGEKNDQVDLEFGFDVVALAPVGVLGFIIDDDFHLLG